MSVVTIAEAWPAAGRPFTVAELDRMPDDGHRYELLDGALQVDSIPGQGTIFKVVLPPQFARTSNGRFTTLS